MADNSKAEFGKSPESLKRGKFKVLIIENDIDFIFIIKDQFKERKDIDITFSIAGEKALDILWKAKEMEEPFNLVVTDSSLVGELNGVEVAEAVKEKKFAQRTFVLSVFPERLTTEMKKKGVGEIIPKTEITRLPNSVSRELLRQRDPQAFRMELRVKPRKEIKNKAAEMPAKL